jgi:hypothetical protein
MKKKEIEWWKKRGYSPSVSSSTSISTHNSIKHKMNFWDKLKRFFGF